MSLTRVRRSRAYGSIYAGELTPEERASVLGISSGDDVFNRGVTDVSDRKDDGRGASADSTQIVCEREDRPVVLHSAEVGVFGVGQHTVIDKLRTNDNVLAGLECSTDHLNR